MAAVKQNNATVKGKELPTPLRSVLAGATAGAVEIGEILIHSKLS